MRNLALSVVTLLAALQLSGCARPTTDAALKNFDALAIQHHGQVMIHCMYIMGQRECYVHLVLKEEGMECDYTESGRNIDEPAQKIVERLRKP